MFIHIHYIHITKLLSEFILEREIYEHIYFLISRSRLIIYPIKKS